MSRENCDLSPAHTQAFQDVMFVLKGGFPKGKGEIPALTYQLYSEYMLECHLPQIIPHQETAAQWMSLLQTDLEQLHVFSLVDIFSLLYRIQYVLLQVDALILQANPVKHPAQNGIIPYAFVLFLTAYSPWRNALDSTLGKVQVFARECADTAWQRGPSRSVDVKILQNALRGILQALLKMQPIVQNLGL